MRWTFRLSPKSVLMKTDKRKNVSLIIVVLFCLACVESTVAWAQQTKRPFSVDDDIELTVFQAVIEEDVLFSPDGNYFVVESERGRVGLNRPEDSLTFYRSGDVLAFLNDSNQSQPPAPVWAVSRSTYKEGPIIKRWRWLPDSSGIAFLDRTSRDVYRLVLADLRKKTVEPLTQATDAVDQFDISDRQNYVYTAPAPTERQKLYTSGVPAIVGTSHTLNELILPEKPLTKELELFAHGAPLWAVVRGRRFEVKHDGAEVFIDSQGRTPQGLVLSPDGSSVVAAVAVPEAPSSWATLYPPPFTSSPSRVRTEPGSAHQWVRINLKTGSIQSLTDAPKNPQGSWGWMFAGPIWSSDGQSVLLPGTFVKSRDNIPSRPCVAVVDFSSNIRSCVEVLKGRTQTGSEEGFHHLQEVRFVAGDKNRVLVRFRKDQDEYSFGSTEYERTADGGWRVVGQDRLDFGGQRNGLKVTVKEGLNEPPLLVATYKQKSRVIWDPNPQLKSVELAEASVYEWKDRKGRAWRGGLFKPNGYKTGQRYPLVIQTHGFTESKFIPSGIYTTAFAARALAAVGIVVLQVSENVCPAGTPEEGPCGASGYESGAEQLVSEGLVDPERIGIIGFSRTCWYVMDTLTFGALRLRAASITEGVMADYFQDLITVDQNGGYDSMIGSSPYGTGLHLWLERSPGFNVDKITSPLLVVAGDPSSLLMMWGPYAGLRYLKKPVDLIVLNTDEHVLTNPSVRLASQGGSVDWFRFWLQDHEDPNPAKAEQYARWHELRKLQQEEMARK
jgi:dipeptidyl aminopeptidase/acylaminoacyl peptidase